MINDEKINGLIETGQYWKARDILCGRFAHSGFDVDLLESVGELYLKMHDNLTAGKYLFLSGARKAEYNTAIDSFLEYNKNKDNIEIFCSFPKAIQKAPFSAYPNIVITTLKELGFRQSDLKKAARHRYPKSSTPQQGRLLRMFFNSVAILLLIGFLISAVKGVISLFRFIF